MIDPCSNCGVCCSHFRISFHWLETASDSFNVPTEMTSKINDHLVCMKGTEAGGKPCIALNQEGRCSIYNNRPSACRDYKVWDEQGEPNQACQKLREKNGIPLLKHFSEYQLDNITNLEDYK